MSTFKEHILIEKHLKDGKYNLDVWDLIRPDSEYTQRIRFINSCGTLTVNGDFGNWIFCREFYPSKNGFVSRSYWDEKLQIASVQESHIFCSDETKKLLDEFIKKQQEYYQYKGKEIPEEITEWFDSLDSALFDKIEYESVAYREKPSRFDYDDIPYGEKRHIWLDIVYDAFNELCKRQ